MGVRIFEKLLRKISILRSDQIYEIFPSWKINLNELNWYKKTIALSSSKFIFSTRVHFDRHSYSFSYERDRVLYLLKSIQDICNSINRKRWQKFWNLKSEIWSFLWSNSFKGIVEFSMQSYRYEIFPIQFWNHWCIKKSMTEVLYCKTWKSLWDTIFRS